MATISDKPALTERERKRLARQQLAGSAFDVYERVFGAFDDGTVFDYGEYSAEDIATMLSRSGKARSVYRVITLPIRGASVEIEPCEAPKSEEVKAEAKAQATPDPAAKATLNKDGSVKLADDKPGKPAKPQPDKPKADKAKQDPDAALHEEITQFVRDVLGDRLNGIVDQMSTAMAYRRAFFEVTWKMQDGKVVYDKIAFRPATSCEAGFDPRTGEPKGFRQRITPVAGVYPQGYVESPSPGYAVIKPERAFVYTHGAFESPIKGVSDLDVALWAYETQQKIMFLWFQFLQNQSLPKTFVYADDLSAAQELAEDVASMTASGVMGLPRPADPGSKAFEVLESSGQGAAQFKDAVIWLSSTMVDSVLAGFTELATTAAAQGTGSYALSADQSEFFLASRQAVADEIAEAIRCDLIGPLVRYNYGADAPLPKVKIGPLSQRDTDRALNLLTAVVASPQLNIPREFIDLLTMQVSEYLGLDADRVEGYIEAEVERRKEQDQLRLAQQKQLLANPMGAMGGAAPAAKNSGKPAEKPAHPARPTSAQPGTGKASRPGKGGAPGQGKPAKPGTSAAARAGGAAAVKLSAAVELANTLVRRASAGEDPQAVLAELSGEVPWTPTD